MLSVSKAVTLRRACFVRNSAGANLGKEGYTSNRDFSPIDITLGQNLQAKNTTRAAIALNTRH